jgi:hypothetical protein
VRHYSWPSIPVFVEEWIDTEESLRGCVRAGIEKVDEGQRRPRGLLNKL